MDDNYDDENNEESGYEEIIEDQILDHEVYVFIEDYIDSTMLQCWKIMRCTKMKRKMKERVHKTYDIVK
jgi:hypothetical protein